jgi:ribosomal protein S12 methylthiotransferase
VRECRFERLGVFTYSRVEGTLAFELGDPVPAEEKERRRAEIMEIQQEVSEDRNIRLIGTRCRVLIDGKEDGTFIGRTEHDAPEIDNEVLISSEHPLSIGSFCDVEIVDAYEHDLVGRL